MRSSLSTSRRLRQRGSALLIVFAFAAIVAIMLYKEIPVAAFEARRNKEELLVERGNEYKRAVKLYVRKFQTFPPSIEALESTNRMRFLRRKYIDPFTGNPDWRLLHAGPGGMIIDSKIKPTGLGTPGAPGNGSQQPGTGFGSLGSTGFGNNNNSPASGSSFGSGFGNSNSQTNNQAPAGDPAQTAGPVAPVVPLRPPAISVSGSSGLNPGNSDSPQIGVPQDEQQTVNLPPPDAPVDPANPTALQNQNGNPAMMTSSMPMATSSVPGDGIPSAVLSMRRNNMLNSASYPNPMATASNSPYPGYPGPPIANTDSQSGVAAGGNPQTVTQNLLANQGNNGTQTQTQTPATNSGASGMGTMGTTTSPGIAGVASIAKGKTIKKINDQNELSLWEFVYDMQKEANALAPGLGGSTTANNAITHSQNSPQNTVNSTGNAFGQQQSPQPQQ